MLTHLLPSCFFPLPSTNINTSQVILDTLVSWNPKPARQAPAMEDGEDEEDDPFADSEDDDIMGGERYNKTVQDYKQYYKQNDESDEWDF
ncbi:unnamed protein product [Fusarium graminearum]|nr:unnamed protein product [Fusarium graminearum]